MRKRVWVFYRWMYLPLMQRRESSWIYLVSSKASFQLNVVQMKKEGNPYEVLAEGNDRVLLEQMCKLAKGE